MDELQVGQWGGLKTGWADKLKGLWPAFQRPAEGQSLVVCHKLRLGSSAVKHLNYWIWMLRTSAPSESLEMIQNWEKWQVFAVPPNGHTSCYWFSGNARPQLMKNEFWMVVVPLQHPQLKIACFVEVVEQATFYLQFDLWCATFLKWGTEFPFPFSQCIIMLVWLLTVFLFLL